MGLLLVKALFLFPKIFFEKKLKLFFQTCKKVASLDFRIQSRKNKGGEIGGQQVSAEKQ